MPEVKLESLLVGQIKGVFRIPSYQRGYRWSKEEVARLLEDIYSNGTNNYCLQPIVVRNKEDHFELIDGQQRLTTIFLLYKYLHDASFGFIDEPRFGLQYETRDKSETFLSTLPLEEREDNIDYWFMGSAYEVISDWFTSRDKTTVKSTMTNFNKYLDENVKVIWYEIDNVQDSEAIALFERLNIGKIPLTSAELVKAMFLSEAGSMQIGKERQQEIALQWDNIERELHSDSLWYFLSNETKKIYQTRIDLVLDLMSGKKPEEKDSYFTFFYFDELRHGEAGKSLLEIWQEIQRAFLVLKDWHENHELYHKVGYLIASEHSSLSSLFDLAQGKTKTDFRNALDELIKDSLLLKSKSYSELSYENEKDKPMIHRLLLLFNIESVRGNGAESQWFPFERFKDNKSGTWSLEHIHAQQSEGMNKKEDWKEWLKLHVESLKVVCPNDLEIIIKVEEAISDPNLNGTTFNTLQKDVLNRLSAKDPVEYEHSIANLTLLNSSQNTALSNSTFDVKRNKIVKFDKEGKFIPFCTKMVFLKYYTPSNENQLHFWGEPDRKAYIAAINDLLSDYLPETIELEESELN